jgi:hypothetical protein
LQSGYKANCQRGVPKARDFNGSVGAIGGRALKEPISILRLKIVPADGIRLPFSGSGDLGTSRFWAALSQGNLRTILVA